MTTTKTKKRTRPETGDRRLEDESQRPLPVEIPPAPAQQDDFEPEDREPLATESTENTERAEAAETPDSENSVPSVAEPPASELQPSASSLKPPVPSADRAHLDKIKAARAVVAERERVYLSCKSKAKQAKEAFEEAVADLTAVIDDGEECLPLFDGEQAGDNRPEAEGTSTPASSLQPPAENNAWRNASIDELRLSPKITEKLVEAGCDSIGALEDLRASHKGLRSIGGIGQKKIDIIEDAIVKWLTENRDREVFDRAAGSPPADKGVDAEFDSEYAKQIHARAVEIDNGQPDSLQQKEPMRPWWGDGKRAYEEGEPLESCLWIAGKEQDDWIRGWLHSAPVEKSTADKTAAAR